MNYFLEFFAVTAATDKSIDSNRKIYDKYKNANSILFLNKAMNYIEKNNAEIINLDINLICDYPKINPIKSKLKKSLSNLLKVEVDKINIKATSTEDQGFINFKNGIASQAIISIESINE